MSMSNNVTRKLKLILRPTKKKVIILAVVAVVAGVGISVAVKVNRAKAVISDAVQQAAYRTVTLQKSSLADSVTVTGTVESGDVANVTTQLTMPVEEILVQVGDYVQEGDVICRLDSSDLEKELAKKQESLSTDKETAQRNYDSAVSSLTAAQERYNSAYNIYASAATDLETKRAAFLPAQSSVKTYQDAYDQALAAEQAAGAALNADAGIVAAQTAVSSAQAALQAAQAAKDEAAIQAAQQALDAANAQLAAAQAAAQGLADAYNNAVAARQTAESNLNTAKANCNYEALYNAYAAADTACSTAKTSYDSAKQQVDSAQQQVDSAKELLDNETTQDAIEDLQEQIADCTITATASGTITNLNATVGSMASSTAGTALATIQDTDALKVAVTIDENDIKKVSVGQRAVIKSDATGDAEIAGTLSQLSVTSSAQGGGFTAEVTVDQADSGLLIGLSAQVELILSESDGVYSVPYDAVETDENGGQVVYVQDGDDWKAVPVTTGMETDYYVEIRGDELQDGMQVRVPIGSAGGTDDLMEQMMSMGGGITIEAAPSGGPGGGEGGMAMPAAPMG